jgi:hypothetical protein
LPYMTIRKCWWWYLFLPKIWIDSYKTAFNTK